MKSLRLKTLASFILATDKVADIGCDHGLLSIFLATQIGCKDIIASDVNQNALNNAIANIKQEKLEDKITTVLSDGLNNIDVNQIDTIVISGMGTSTILNILEDDGKLVNVTKMVIQSNNNLDILRKEIVAKGFYIKDEVIVYENKKYYVIIEFLKGKKKYSAKELLYGPILLKKKYSVDYYKSLLEKQLDILNKIPRKKIFLYLKNKKRAHILKKCLKSNN